jgi:hypothetical protein
MHQTFVLVRNVSELGPRKPASHFEKQKAKLALRSEKRLLDPPAPPALKLKTQLRGFCHPPNFFAAGRASGET